jgi:hypothetical protein
MSTDRLTRAAAVLALVAGIVLLQIGLCHGDTTAPHCCAAFDTSIEAAPADVAASGTLESAPADVPGGVAEACLMVLLGVLLGGLLLDRPAVTRLRLPPGRPPAATATAIASPQLHQLCVLRT